MPSYVCLWPTCQNILPAKGYCEECQKQGRAAEVSQSHHYDKHKRDQNAKIFYNSSKWQQARNKKISSYPVCQECDERFAQHVHHIKNIKDYPRLMLDQSNLMSLCIGCHNMIEARGGK